jgi:hypothetical protein
MFRIIDAVTRSLYVGIFPHPPISGKNTIIFHSSGSEIGRIFSVFFPIFLLIPKMDALLHAIDRDVVQDVNILLVRKIVGKMFSLPPMACWDRAMSAKSVKVLEYLDARFELLEKLFYDEHILKDLEEVKKNLDRIEQEVPPLLQRVTNLFWSVEYPGTVSVRQYLLTKGYLPSHRNPIVDEITTWHILTISSHESRFNLRLGILSLCNLFITPSFLCVSAHSEEGFGSFYVRHDNFKESSSNLITTIANTDSSLYLTQSHADCLEALLWRGVFPLKLVDCLSRNWKQDLLAKRDELRFGVRLRAALGMK